MNFHLPNSKGCSSTSKKPQQSVSKDIFAVRQNLISAHEFAVVSSYDSNIHCKCAASQCCYNPTILLLNKGSLACRCIVLQSVVSVLLLQ